MISEWTQIEGVIPIKDTTPPDVPTISVVPILGHVQLIFSRPSALDFFKFQVEQAPDDNGAPGSPATIYEGPDLRTHVNFSATETRWFRVRAWDRSQNVSGWSAWASGSPLALPGTQIDSPDLVNDTGFLDAVESSQGMLSRIALSGAFAQDLVENNPTFETSVTGNTALLQSLGANSTFINSVTDPTNTDFVSGVTSNVGILFGIATANNFTDNLTVTRGNIPLEEMSKAIIDRTSADIDFSTLPVQASVDNSTDGVLLHSATFDSPDSLNASVKVILTGYSEGATAFATPRRLRVRLFVDGSAVSANKSVAETGSNQRAAVSWAYNDLVTLGAGSHLIELRGVRSHSDFDGEIEDISIEVGGVFR